MRGRSSIQLAIIYEVEDDPATIAVASCTKACDALRLQRVDDALDASDIVRRAVTTYPCHEVELGPSVRLCVRRSQQAVRHH